MQKKNVVIPFDKRAKVSINQKQVELYGKDAIDLMLKDRVFYKSPITDSQVEELLNATFERRVLKKGEEVEISIPISNVIINSRDRQYIIKGLAEDRVNLQKTYDKNMKRWEGNHPNKKFPLKLKDFLKYLYPYPTKEELKELEVGYPWDIVKDKGWRGISLYAQRGCNWGKCSYCAIATPIGRKLRISYIIKILREAVKNGVKTVSFDDDQFVQDQSWVMELCDEIIKHGLNKKLAFGAMIRVDAIKDFELLKKLGDANFGRLQIGVESFVKEKIRYFNKTSKGREKEYIKKAKRLISTCLKFGIAPGVFIILTRPKEEHPLLEIAEELLIVSEIIKDSIDNEPLPIFSFNDMLMAYPGAPLVKTEKYKKILLPLRPVEITENKKTRIEVETLEIPYVFEFRNMALTNFIGNLMEISERRGMPPETLNETWEHVEDATYALEISARHLDSDIGIAFEFVRELGTERFENRKVKALVSRINNGVPEESRITSHKDLSYKLDRFLGHGILTPQSLKEAINDREMKEFIEREIPTQLRKEKNEVLKKCRTINENMRKVEEIVHKKVKGYLAKTKNELREIEKIHGGKEFANRVNEIRERTERFSENIHPYLRGRNALESLVEWISEFKAQRIE